ncbi:MAG: hypothetical protein ICV59_01295 [Thermoleophilia bacterium]|nr:hypothetical protein [Thermoleophilia bacterium]
MKVRLAMAFVLAFLVAATLPTVAGAGMHDGHGRIDAGFGMHDGHGKFSAGMHDGHGKLSAGMQDGHG